jgi:hypothetical protein
MNGRRVCQLLLVLAVSGASGAAMAGGGGGYHGGGGGYYHGGGGGGYNRGYHHGGHCCGGSIGFYLGPGFVYGYPYPYYAYPPYYYPGYYPYGPTAPGVASSPTQYIEQQGQDGQADMGGGAEPQAAYWYHCGKPEGYYPYIKACPGGWQRVPTQPPGS